MTHDAHDLDARDGARDERRPPVDLEAYAATTRADPPPVWRTLDLVRGAAFTGEVVFEASPEVRAYFDRGEVYYAEPAGVPPIGQRLVDAGVVDVGQLRRGTVRVGDVEHLGRLFDREPSVERDAAVLVVERETEVTVAAIADDHWPIRVSPYRHHPSGVHRWFVAPVHPSLVPRPLSAVAQVDRTVIDELPTLGTGADHARIEWDEPGPFDGLDRAIAGGGAGPGFDVDWAELDSDPSRADGLAGGPTPVAPAEGSLLDEAVVAPSEGAAPGGAVAGSGVADEGDFQLVWPDGTEETPMPLPPTVLEELQAEEPEVVVDDVILVPESFVRFDAESRRDDVDGPGASPGVVDESGRPEAPDVAATAPAVVEELPPPGASVPEDVAAAVRRALTAIEAVSAGSTTRSTLPPVDPDDLVVGAATGDTLPPPVPFEPPPPEAVASPASFAPPTPETSAESLYGLTAPPSTLRAPVSGPAAGAAVEAPASGPAVEARVAGPAVDGEAAPSSTVPAAPLPHPVAEPAELAAPSTPAPDGGARPPVVFLDDEIEEDERAGALRRLISSLRRKR